MLRIYSFIIETLKVTAPIIRQIAKHDVDLARQARRAASSIALNTAEGYGNSAGNERLRYRSALGSTQEVRLRSMSRKLSDMSMRSMQSFEIDSTASLPRSIASLRDEAVEHCADGAQTRNHLRVDALDVAERSSDIETSSALFR
jgi:four helix bundle protein